MYSTYTDAVTASRPSLDSFVSVQRDGDVYRESTWLPESALFVRCSVEKSISLAIRTNARSDTRLFLYTKGVCGVPASRVSVSGLGESSKGERSRNLFFLSVLLGGLS